MRARISSPAPGIRPPGRTLFMFTSERDPTLHAFCGDNRGDKLPERHGPWNETGQALSGKPMPHGLSRSAAEELIGRQGFALWRIKTDQAASQ